jgi:3-phosphoshikimate 1-carboxyvinyltransferase
MFAPIAAMLPGTTTLEAKGTLTKRDVSMAVSPIEALGGSCGTMGGFPPLTIAGTLRGGSCALDGSASSQALSGMLIALSMAERDSELAVRGLTSRGYVDLTMATMRAFGVVSERDESFTRFCVPGRQRFAASSYRVERDWSGAAFLLCAGAIGAEEGLTVQGLDPASPQPDAAILEAIELSGARVVVSENGVTVRRDVLRAFDFDLRACPDLFPPVALLAALCPGVSRLYGVSRLRGKESDRAATIAETLLALGRRATVEGDAMLVHGTSQGSPKPFPGCVVDPRGDHRIAMMAAIASLASSAPVTILDPGCVSKSWPGFYDVMSRIAGDS